MKIIVWDVDDVLNNLMEIWFYEKWTREHPECSFSYDNLTENPPHRILGVSLEDYLESLDSFRKESYMTLEPKAEVLHWFNLYGHKFRHIALTATPIHTSSIVAHWVLKNFCKWIRTIHIIPSFRHFDNSPVYEKNKGDFFEWFSRVDLFIDDSITNISLGTEKGIKTILWPQPWNRVNRSISETLLDINKILELEHEDESIRLRN